MSNAQSWAETFAPINSHNRDVVYKATWGHLAPIKNKVYKCMVLFSVSAYHSGTRELIDTWFDGLDDSPWLYDSLQEMINDFDINRELAGVYQFDGQVKNYLWKGSLKLIYKLNSQQNVHGSVATEAE
jgi:hypothetical protein